LLAEDDDQPSDIDLGDDFYYIMIMYYEKKSY